MKITAEHVTGHVFVVAVDETEALEHFESGNTYETERDAIEHETYRNDYDRHHSGEAMNTYRIEIPGREDPLRTTREPSSHPRRGSFHFWPDVAVAAYRLSCERASRRQAVPTPSAVRHDTGRACGEVGRVRRRHP